MENNVDLTKSSVADGSEHDGSPKHVVIIRVAQWVSTDTRMKNLAKELLKNGYEVTVVHCSETKRNLDETRDGVRYLAIHVDRVMAQGMKSKRERKRFNLRSPLWLSQPEYRMRNLQAKSERQALSRELQEPLSLVTKIQKRARRKQLHVSVNIRRKLYKRRVAKNRKVRERYDSVTEGVSWRETEPQLLDYDRCLGKVVDKLDPDLIYVMDSTALGIGVGCATRAAERGKKVPIATEILENWAGLPVGEGGQTLRRMAAMVEYEREYLPSYDAVIAINDPIKRALNERYDLPVEVGIVRNCTRLSDRRVPKTSLREELGVSEDTPLLVYGGGITPARGFEVAVKSLAYAPEFTLGIIPVPFPHPMMGGLIDLAESLGVEDRLKFAPPVGSDEIINYLSDADIGLILFDTEAQNHREATPNKLFEYLHAGLPIVTTRIEEPEAIVTRYDFGEAFDYPDAQACAEAYQRVYRRIRSGEIVQPSSEVLEEYSWENQSRFFVDSINQLAEGISTKGTDLIDGTPNS
ncbi:MAG: glycosyltransferase family 4 protein [Candidatus Nanopelagicales bacterium]